MFQEQRRLHLICTSTTATPPYRAYSTGNSHLCCVDGRVERAPLAAGPGIVEAREQRHREPHPGHTNLRRVLCLIVHENTQGAGGAGGMAIS